ncbi:MAG: hypothetical protein K8S54_17300 [Spirochaetia bacterium]|nr:hypothetical protein [Spirochaetia bacterium]
MQKPSHVFLIDAGLSATAPLSRFRSFFSIRDGIYSPLARLRKSAPGAEIVLYHTHLTYERLIAQVESDLGTPCISFQDSQFAKEAARTPLEIQQFAKENNHQYVLLGLSQVFGRLDSIGQSIENDLPVYLAENDAMQATGSFTIVGDPSKLFVHASAKIHPGVIFNTEEGPIVIDSDAQITPFSILSGPLYVGPSAMLDHIKVSGSIIGQSCRLGGEIESSTIGDFTNKHHEGFVGHSMIGNWVNLGALTTTSDLKNNYGKIRLRLPGGDIETGRIKFGSILGDCVKTAIGTMINTGSVIDAGCNLFGGGPPAYLSPLSWGLAGRSYAPDRFMTDCETIFARRKQNVPKGMRGLVDLIVSLDAGSGSG